MRSTTDRSCDPRELALGITYHAQAPAGPATAAQLHRYEHSGSTKPQLLLSGERSSPKSWRHGCLVAWKRNFRTRRVARSYDCGPLALNTRPARSNRSYEDDRRTFTAHFEQCGTSSYGVRRADRCD
jgi:hypothetical protein